MSRFDELKVSGTQWYTTNQGVDKVGGCMVSIPYEHHEVHEGDHFGILDYATGQALGVVVAFIITTPNTTKWAHFIPRIYSSTGATIEIHHTPTGVTGGTSITPVNSNRNSATSPTITVVKDPSAITSYGTRLFGLLAGGAKVAGGASREDEWILKQNTVYSIKITSLANNNDIAWDFQWYEHTNSN